MEQEKLTEFNKELTELLNKYGATLAIEQKIVVAPKPVEKVEVEQTKE